MTTTSVAKVKVSLSAYIDSVYETQERVIITRNGEPAAILISPADLESLEETIALLSDPEAMQEIAQAKMEFANGKGADAADIQLRTTR
jgi:antitoxin YefM